MSPVKLRWAAAAVAVALMIAAGVPGIVLAQDATPEPPAPACVPDEVTACVNIVFFPAGLTGDLVLVDQSVDPAVEQPTPQVQSNSLWLTFTTFEPGASVDVVVKNIHDGAAMDTILYVYPDIAQTVTAPTAANTTRKVTLYPVKKYIRGRVDARCSPQSVLAGEDVGCQLTLDGTPVEGVVPAGQAMTFYLDAGKHTIQFDLAGASVALWSPPSQIKTPTVYAGSYTNVVTATFAKANHVLAKLSLADWIGDWYMDGVLQAVQAPTLDMFVAGNASHKIEVKNLALNGSPAIHPYSNTTRVFFASANGTSNITVTPVKFIASNMVSVSGANAEGIALTTDDFLYWRPVWGAQSAELAEATADQLIMGFNVDGAYGGDISPYRTAARESSSGGPCGDPAYLPCWVVGWTIPLGRMGGGQHFVLSISFPFFGDVSNGWEVFPAGSYFQWDEEFTVNGPPTPPLPAPAAGAVCNCTGDFYNCDTFTSTAVAQQCFNTCTSLGAGDIHGLDGDNDKLVCEG